MPLITDGRSTGLLKRIAISIFLSLSIIATALSCGGPKPEHPVQTYLQLLSGEIPFSQRQLDAVTTENYRNSDRAHLLTAVRMEGKKPVDLVEELRNDPVLQKVFELVSWDTRYEVYEKNPSEARVVARVIMTEKRPGDRAKALAIPDLPDPIRDVLERGLELPFQFELKKEDGMWKIDDLTMPAVLLPLLDLPGIAIDEGEDD